MSGSTLGFMDIIIVIGGLYLVYMAVQMKRTGEITNNSMIGRGVDLKKAKDPKGYIDYMYPRAVVVGILVAVSGVVDYLNELYWSIPYFGLGICVVFLILILIYGKMSMDAQKKYLSSK